MCIESWKKYLPDFEFKLWNETNVDMNHPFVAYAYKNKKWAFVSDYVRLKALQEYGGVYLDTDMFVIKKIDELLTFDFFIGAETKDLLNCAVFGAVANHPILNETLVYYDESTLTERYFRLGIPRVITRAFCKLFPLETKIYDKEVCIENTIMIYSEKYFYPMPFIKDRSIPKDFIKFATAQTHAIHLWEGSWHTYSEFEYIRRRQFKEGLRVVLKQPKSKIFTTKYIRKLISSIKIGIINNYD